MENFFDDDVSVQEMELLEPNYEVFMKWAQPTTIWDTISNRIRMATISSIVRKCSLHLHLASNFATKRFVGVRRKHLRKYC
ncbi:CLUMA_CG009438, isoform A [Clunio marinus]|uniref:CLUMA_CG009438, isoform A n=1 Tax=Clunio marinus TaxID=568069 RepID=A0A1J1IAL1_9DIPT|nr:CLUMA_CG009438, isoform A [Clunio marinus]